MWKPTKIEQRDSFITHIRDDSYLRLTIDQRRSNYLKRGLTLPPFIVIVGPTLSDIKSYFVVLNTDVFYSRKNIVSAVDSCFKSIWALNLEYSSECYGVWYFIQKGFFKLTSAHDKGSTSVESLLTDCMWSDNLGKTVVCFLCKIKLNNFSAYSTLACFTIKLIVFATCAEENSGRI